MVSVFDKLEIFGVNSHTVRALMNSLWPQHQSLEVDITFAAATTGKNEVHELFTVTGLVEVALIAVCTTDVTGTGTIQAGTALDTDSFIADTTGSNIIEHEIWHDAAPDNSVEASSVIARKLCAENIDYLISTNTLTAGTIKFILFWNPVSSDGKVVVT